MENQLLKRLREPDPGSALPEEFAASGTRFAASSESIELRYCEAVRQLFACIVPAGGGKRALLEGGVYHGCWLESTGTINAEILSRFVPGVAEATFDPSSTVAR